MICSQTSHVSGPQALIRGRLFRDPVFFVPWNYATSRTTGDRNKNDKMVCWQGWGLGEAGAPNFVGGTINWKKKRLLKSDFAICDKS